MITKLKQCSNCSAITVIWKRVGLELYCKYCWYKIKPPKPIKHVSKIRSKESSEYNKLRIRYLIDHPNCEIHLPKCTLTSTDIHHTFSGKDRAKYYLDTSTWKASCRRCHEWVHNHSKEARELNLLK